MTLHLGLSPLMADTANQMDVHRRSEGKRFRDGTKATRCLIRLS
jgi:hypothetical protein